MGREIPVDAPAGNGTISCNLCGEREHRFLFRKAGFDLVECEKCGLTFIANPPSEQAVAALCTAKADCQDELIEPSSAAFRRMRQVAKQHLRMLGRSIAEPDGVRLLDIGCSNGLFLAEARARGYDVHGTEISPETAQFARGHFGLRVHTGSYEFAGFDKGSFDVVTLFDVTEHLPDPSAELNRIREYIKPGGLLLQSTPNIDGLFPRLSFALANRLDYWPHPEPPHRRYQFSVRTIRLMTEMAGFEPYRIDQTRIGFGYSFDLPKEWRKRPKMLAYAALFAPTAVIGPWIGRGDWVYLAARRPG
jgi:2-polyprenyl-3-methyl-5-hydroxy-6-metoxy-1,4-benzoquinol methylase